MPHVERTKREVQASRERKARARKRVASVVRTKSVIGRRVQMHPATDAWMRGDRYGVVVGLGRKREYVDRFADGTVTKEKPLRVKLDKSGRIVRVHPDEPTFNKERNILLVERNAKRKAKTVSQRDFDQA